jgi:hypothetical protein
MGLRRMKAWIWSILFVASFSSCKLSHQHSGFNNSSVQIVDMGQFNGLRIIEIASLHYPETESKNQAGWVFSEIDEVNFNESLIQSLRRSDVRVLPSAQTKIHLNFTQIGMIEIQKDTILTMTADVIVSRNGIITKKLVKISSKANFTSGSTKNNGVKMFIQAIGELLREQSSFKR